MALFPHAPFLEMPAKKYSSCLFAELGGGKHKPALIYMERDVESLLPQRSTDAAVRAVLTKTRKAMGGGSGFAAAPKLSVCVVKAEGSVTLLSDLDFQVRCSRETRTRGRAA